MVLNNNLNKNHIKDFVKSFMNAISENGRGVFASKGFTADFDAEDRVVSWQRGSANKSWDLSLTGNWNSVSDDGVAQDRTYNDTNQLLTTTTSQVNQNYTYDKRGNQTTRPNSSALQLLKWDIDGHLQSISVGEETKALYAYDALGRRLKKTTYDDAGTASYRLYIRSGQRVLEEYKSTNDSNYSIDRRYIYGSYIDDVLGFYRGSYQFLYHHSDRQYNSRCLTDWAKRAIEYTSYTPYGSRIIDTRWYGKNRTTSVYGNTLGFTGRHYEKESGLYYFRARYYDSGQGRFISRDPAGYIDGMGLYNGYFASRFMLDPSGRICVDNYYDVTFDITTGNVGGFPTITESNFEGNLRYAIDDFSIVIVGFSTTFTTKRTSKASSFSNNNKCYLKQELTIVVTVHFNISLSVGLGPFSISLGTILTTMLGTNSKTFSHSIEQ